MLVELLFTGERNILLIRLVEAAGVEPASEDLRFRTSTYISSVFYFAIKHSQRQDYLKAILKKLRFLHFRPNRKLSCIYNILSLSTGETEEDVAA